MRLSIISICIYGILLFHSCSTPVTNEITGAQEILIDVKHQSAISLDSIIEKIEYIKLETTNNNIIGQISQLFFIDSLLIVVDSKVAMTINVFNFAGQFKYSIGKQGNGPGEYVQISNVCIEPQNKLINILDRMQNRVISYALDGSYKQMENTPFPLLYFEFLETGNRAYYKSGLVDPVFGNFINNPLIVTDSMNNIIYGSCADLYVANQFDYEMNKPLRKFNNEVYFSPNFSNVIYTVTDSIVIPKYYINIAWNGMPPINTKTTNELFREYCSKHFIFNGDIIELKDLTFINIMTPSGYPFVIYSHAKQKTFFSTDHGNHPLFPFLKNLAPKTCYNDNVVVFDISSFSLMLNKKELYQSTSDKKLLDDLYDGLTEDANPILLLCRLNKNI